MSIYEHVAEPVKPTSKHDDDKKTAKTTRKHDDEADSNEQPKKKARRKRNAKKKEKGVEVDEHQRDVDRARWIKRNIVDYKCEIFKLNKTFLDMAFDRLSSFDKTTEL